MGGEDHSEIKSNQTKQKITQLNFNPIGIVDLESVAPIG